MDFVWVIGGLVIGYIVVKLASDFVDKADKDE